jgi:hypothetical protein
VADPSETTQVSLGSAGREDAELVDAIRALSAQVGGLQSEVQSLRAQSQSRGLPGTRADAPSWDATAPARRESSPWIRSLDGPGPRAPAVPRLLLEVVFLIAVAAAAAIAELSAPVIIVLMVAAWGLVAASEWMAARAAQRRAEMSLAPLPGGGTVLADDPSWFAPPLERTAFGEVEVEDVEDTAEGLSLPPSP